MKKFFSLIAFALFATWILGFILFIKYIQTLNPDDNIVKTDAIVVLTGGSQRIATAAELFKQDYAKKMFISGVGGGAKLKAMTGTDIIPEEKKFHIVLGRDAENTKENAIETAEWIKKEGFKSLLLVTAAYHMPRSLFELKKAMPDVTLIPYPVFPQALQNDNKIAFKWLFIEYNKFIAVVLWSWIRG